MTDSSKPLTGDVIPPRKKATPGALEGFAALNQLVGAARECITIHALENTKQARIQAYAHTEIARIKAAESVLRDYFAQAFAERRVTTDAMFERLDAAIETGDSQVISDVVRAVVDIAKSSPLKDMGDLSQIRAALDDPDQVWDL
ncbi:hypothetical protein GP2_024_00050 [Gordonia paraffinivorans NBRC 108238]|uniref:Uncharacterized protein n=1 Tax=Gordonia paraffinivorans NBRC 108238 TaxID=1223543 RepID=A0ABQ0ILY7_9ACTN|nr:hypothetical protein [Gordonia paraffinivorans]GAC84578.1 hypothetical protein GP2_024_00050 [Gordonia paraffinivorans NBRC 108238]